MIPDQRICRQVTAILRRYNLTVEKLSANYRNGRLQVDGAKKTEVISEIRAAVDGLVTLEELAAYINISPSSISFFTDKDIAA